LLLVVLAGVKNLASVLKVETGGEDGMSITEALAGEEPCPLASLENSRRSLSI